MQTVRGQKIIDISTSGFRSTFSQVPVSANQAKRLKIKEFISWSVCFGLVTVLTGLMKFLKTGLTMDSVTSILFFSSLAGLVYFVYKIVLVYRHPEQMNTHPLHELN
jgi:hypothetical protein